METIFEPTEKIQRKILRLLLSGQVLTTLTGNQLASTVDFRKAISVLRQKGYPISDEWSTNPNNTKRFKRYFFDETYLKQAQK